MMTELDGPLLSTFAGIALYASGHHFYIGLRRRALGSDVFFSIMALAIGALNFSLLLMHRAATIDEYLFLMKWHAGSHVVAMTSLLWLVASYTNYKPYKLLALLTTITVPILVGLMVHPYGMVFGSVPQLTTSTLAWGESVTTAVGTRHPYAILDHIVFLSFVLMMTYALFRQFKLDRQRAAALAIGLLFFLAPNVYELIFTSTLINQMPLDEFSFVGIVIVMSLALSQDALELTTVKRTLRRTEAQYRHLVENLRSEYVLFSRDANGAWTYVSPSIEELLGYSQMVFLKHNAEYLTSNPVNETAKRHMKLNLLGVASPAYELELVHKNGSVRQLEVIETPIKDDHGVVTTVEGIAHDVTERNRAQREIRAQEERIHDILNATADGIVTIDMQGTVQTLNQSVERTFGYRAEEIIGKNIKMLMPAPYREEHDSYMARYHHTGEAHILDTEREVEGRHKDGTTFPLALRVRQLDRAGERLYIGTVQDITERKRVQEELRRSHEQLRNLAVRLQAVREEERTAIARALHDSVGQVLVGLKLDLQWLASKPPDNPGELQEQVQSMASALDGAVGAAGELALQLRSTVLEDMGLIAAIKWEVEQLSERTDIRYEIDLIGENLTLEPDRALAAFRIAQEALTNVLRHAQAKHVSIRIEVTDGELSMDVQDDGKGITDGDLTDVRSLGLVGMRERALAIGGEVVVYPGEEGGTKVTLKMPVAV